MGLFDQKNNKQVPVWFMRQAGRYHTHYQNIKKNSDFMTMCKTPELACEITMGPIDDFKFDAAILFSDLLFPLEHLGLGLNYLQGPPKLEFHVQEQSDLDRLSYKEEAKDFYAFQGQAVELLKKRLPTDRTLIGFVGAPFTLYTYAVEGSHSGNLVSSKKGLYDGRFNAFFEKLFPSLIEEMDVQAKAGADVISLFDTAAGELCQKDFNEFLVPALEKVLKAFKEKNPNTKVIYYSKFTHRDYLNGLRGLPIDVLGVDWRHDLPAVFKEFSDDFYIQGNIDPCWLHLSWDQLEKNLNHLWKTMQGQDLSKWIFGLGHGVIIKTPEENVRRTVDFVHKNFKL